MVFLYPTHIPYIFVENYSTIVLRLLSLVHLCWLRDESYWQSFIRTRLYLDLILLTTASWNTTFLLVAFATISHELNRHDKSEFPVLCTPATLVIIRCTSADEITHLCQYYDVYDGAILSALITSFCHSIRTYNEFLSLSHQIQVDEL